mmetsp:Transcript_32446/g.36919  ORF Transcript_32446/g.36919 Transcript_32446/m.36919 type:complete len:505 (+) Transcript_32446:42-1556(+)
MLKNKKENQGGGGRREEEDDDDDGILERVDTLVKNPSLTNLGSIESAKVLFPVDEDAAEETTDTFVVKSDSTINIEDSEEFSSQKITEGQQNRNKRKLGKFASIRLSIYEPSSSERANYDIKSSLSPSNEDEEEKKPGFWSTLLWSGGKNKEIRRHPPPQAFSNLAPRRDSSSNLFEGFDDVDESVGNYDSEYENFNPHRSDQKSSSISQTVSQHFLKNNKHKDGKEEKKSCVTKKNIVLGMIAIILIVAGVSLYFIYIPPGKEETDPAISVKSAANDIQILNAATTTTAHKNQDFLTLSPSTPVANELPYDEILLLLLLKTHTSLHDLETPGTPQNNAIWWLTDKDAVQLQLVPSSDLLQQYALAVLYYSTCCDTCNGKNDKDKALIDKTDSEWQQRGETADTYLSDITNSWNNDKNWMSGRNVCDWYGVVCDNNNIIIGLNLSQNNLRGTIPSELVILGGSLRVLDLGNNQLHGTIPPNLSSAMIQLDLLFLENNQLNVISP